MPRARGLFTAAASISGVPTDIPLDLAKEATAALAARLGVSPDRAGFARVPESDLIVAQGGGIQPLEKPTADDLIAITRASTGRLRLGPVVDQDLHPASVEDALRAGASADIPLLVGSTREEFAGMAHDNRHLFEDFDVEELLLRVGLEPSAARRYAAALPGHHPAAVVGQYLSDLMFRRRITEWLDLCREAAAPTWVYDFAWRSQVSGVAEHCLDVPFIFDLLEDPDVERVAGPKPPQALADLVHGSYVSFATDHDPGWAPFARSSSVMIFDDELQVVEGGYESARALA
jgi:para-nitrobenzyl esterase